MSHKFVKILTEGMLYFWKKSSKKCIFSSFFWQLLPKNDTFEKKVPVFFLHFPQDIDDILEANFSEKNYNFFVFAQHIVKKGQKKSENFKENFHDFFFFHISGGNSPKLIFVESFENALD